MTQLITQNLFKEGYKMHIKVKKQDLLDDLSKIQGIAEKKKHCRSFLYECIVMPVKL